jgi:hypothetical protein
VALLVFYRLLDNKTGATSEFQKVDYGVSWGIFVTLLCGVALAYAGQRLRLAHVTEPPLPGEGPTVVDRRPRGESRRPRPPTETPPPDMDGDPPTAATSIATGRRPPARPDIDGGTQLSFDEQE